MKRKKGKRKSKRIKQSETSLSHLRRKFLNSQSPSAQCAPLQAAFSDTFVRSLVRSIVRSLIRSFFRSFVRSIFRSLIRSFFRSFVCLGSVHLMSQLNTRPPPPLSLFSKLTDKYPFPIYKAENILKTQKQNKKTLTKS